MIGNDVIDLHYTALHSKWQHPRFMDKLFTDQEQDRINSSRLSFTTIWELWAIKEAAYKAYIQNNPGRFYNPKAFECNGTGVRYKDFKIEVQTSISSSLIYAETKSNKKVLRNIIKMPIHVQKQGDILRRSLLSEVSKFFDIELEMLNIKYGQSGVPNLYQKESKLDIDLSMTHHGSFAAYSLTYS